MNILLTNDDGIGCEGIQLLAKTLRSRGKYRVYVIAPDSNRSGISHAISILNAPVKLSRLEEDSWSCSGYPADCIIAAMKGALPQKPDLILSGINHGANLGTDITYSGTAAAARQASLWDVPSVALSLAGEDGFYWDMAVSWSADHLEELVGFWKKDTFVNVNIPNSPEGPAGMVMTWPDVKYYNDILTVMNGPDGNRWCFMKAGKETNAPEAGSDCDAVSRNYVSVSSVCIHPAVLKDMCPAAPDYVAVAGRDR